MSFSNSFETALLSLLFNNAPLPGVGDVSGLGGSGVSGQFYVGLHTADPGETGTQSTAETAYPGYARVGVARTGPGWTVTGPTVVNTAQIQFPQCTGTGGTLTHFSIGTDPTGAGTLLLSGPLSAPLAVSAGITPLFAAAALSATLDKAMLTRGMSSLLEALEEGRTHTQRVTKTASASTGGRWTDWAFASGQPGYDTRIGPALEFAPESGVGNASVYTGTPEECCLLSATLRADGAGGPVSVLLFDLVGVYSLVDGDSSEFQPFTHEEPLPRYESGKGVLPLLVSSVAPALSAGLAELSYVDTAGVLRVSDPFAVAAHSIPGQVVQGTAAGASFGGLRLPGVSGVRSVAGIRYLSPPGGLQSVYLIRPVAQLTCNGNPFLATERFFHPAPVLPAGCALHLLFYQQTAAATSFFGQFTFAC